MDAAAPSTMKAAVFHAAGDVRIEDVTVPTPGPGEVLLQVCSVGICGTDAHEYASGPHQFPGLEPHRVTGHAGPMVMGHEFAGRIIARGEGAISFDLGTLVACGAGVSCGECRNCREGRLNLCPQYWTLGLNSDGGLAEYVVAPENICLSVERLGLSEHLAALSQPMSIAVHAASRSRVQSDEDVVIIGAGGIGLFLVRAVSAVTRRVAVVDLDDERLTIATKNGALWTHRVSEATNPAELCEQWGLDPRVVFEVTGNPRGLSSAREWLRPGGRLVLVGLQDGTLPLDYKRTSLLEHELIGTNGHSFVKDFARAVKLLAEGGAWPEIAPEVMPLSDVVERGLAPLAAGSPARVKTLIDPRIDSARASDFAS